MESRQELKCTQPEAGVSFLPYRRTATPSPSHPSPPSPTSLSPVLQPPPIKCPVPCSSSPLHFSQASAISAAEVLLISRTPVDTGARGADANSQSCVGDYDDVCLVISRRRLMTVRRTRGGHKVQEDGSGRGSAYSADEKAEEVDDRESWWGDASAGWHEEGRGCVMGGVAGGDSQQDGGGGIEMQCTRREHTQLYKRYDSVCSEIESHGEFYCRLRDNEGQSLLHWAALAGNLRLCKLLIKIASAIPASTRIASPRSDPNSPRLSTSPSLLPLLLSSASHNGQTALMWAVVKNQLSICRLLLRYQQTEIDAVDSQGASALLLAVQHNHLLVGLLLLAHGASPGLVDGHASNLVHWAAYKGHVTWLRLLDYFGVPFDQVDSSGMVPLHRAAIAQHYDAALYILTCSRAPVSTGGCAQRPPYHRHISQQGMTALDVCRLHAHPNHILLRLLDTSSDIHTKSHPSFSGMSESTYYHPLLATASTSASCNVHVAAATSTGSQRRLGALLRVGWLEGAADPRHWSIRTLTAPAGYLMLMIGGLLTFVFHLHPDLFASSVHLTSPSSYASLATIVFNALLGLWIVVVTFFLAVLRSDPGFTQRTTFGQTDLERLMEAVRWCEDEEFLDRIVEVFDRDRMGRFCMSCWKVSYARSKHCSDCDRCVEVFDHHCEWIANCVGKMNNRLFVCWGLSQLLFQTVHVALTVAYLLKHFHKDGLVSVLYEGVLKKPLVLQMCIVHFCSYVWTLGLFWQQLRNIALNYTTNEITNLHRYDHFWVHLPVWTREGLSLQRKLSNPFDKGRIANCCSFWCHRRRANRDRTSVAPLSSTSSVASTPPSYFYPTFWRNKVGKSSPSREEHAKTKKNAADNPTETSECSDGGEASETVPHDQASVLEGGLPCVERSGGRNNRVGTGMMRGAVLTGGLRGEGGGGKEEEKRHVGRGEGSDPLRAGKPVDSVVVGKTKERTR
eukprot:GHVS01011895.1.p1 GENE.GHVS01011895.1~~GHVS01011895.1.p1  ORF type:complete len:961 (+),score=126.99 GHVS01011895.1:121-3003(+)